MRRRAGALFLFCLAGLLLAECLLFFFFVLPFEVEDEDEDEDEAEEDEEVSSWAPSSLSTDPGTGTRREGVLSFCLFWPLVDPLPTDLLFPFALLEVDVRSVISATGEETTRGVLEGEEIRL